jgi:hypothetical protein
MFAKLPNLRDSNQLSDVLYLLCFVPVGVFSIRHFVPFCVFLYSTFFPCKVFSLTTFCPSRCFLYSTFLTIRRFVPVDVFPFDVLSYSAFFLSKFCPATFLPSAFFTSDILSVNPGHGSLSGRIPIRLKIGRIHITRQRPMIYEILYWDG